MSKNNKNLDFEEENIIIDDDLIIIENKKSIEKNEEIIDDYTENIETTEDIIKEIEELIDVEIENDISNNYIDKDTEDFLRDDNPSEIEENVDFDLIYRLNTNKHRQEGKHTLQRDTIFKGKLEEKNEVVNDGYVINADTIHNDTFKIMDLDFDNYTEDYLNQNNLTKDVFNILETKTDLDFKQNRRKPNKETFNNYYNLLLKELGFRYTKSEIFVELSYYFTDNIFNMFKLLDKRPATIIIKELMQKGYLKNINGIDFL